jgi:oligoendopeptidase F
MEKKGLKTTSTEWNLKPLFLSDDDKAMAEERAIIEKKSYSFINKWKERVDYLKDPKILFYALDEYEELERNHLGGCKESYYFSLRSSQEQDNPKIKARLAKIIEFHQKIENDIQFFEMNIAKIPKENQEMFLNSKDLEKYRHYLEMSFANAKYLLSEPEEKILNLKSQTSYSNWVRMTSGFISKEERKVLLENGKKQITNFSQIMTLMDCKKKNVRDLAAAAFNDILAKHADTAEAELNSILEDKKVNDELRKVERPDKARHISDDIETSAVDSMLDAVSKRYDIAKRYYKLKAKLFGTRKLKYHERNLEYGKINKKFNYTESVNLVHETFKKLDIEFAGIFESFIANGQLDAYPKKGKVHGAFCAGPAINLPTYVLLNHDDKLSDVLTIAHEMGHAINNELMRKKLNALNYDTPLSTAEVASTFMEDFVLNEILNDADEELKFSILMMKLNSDVSSIFRQVACYRFEQELHSEFRKEGYLSKEHIGKIFQKHMSSYMGTYVEMSKGSENWWVYWGHIRHFFYVYSYASGLIISKSLQNSVKKDKRFIVKVKEFLITGESESPREIFLKLGIDINNEAFWNNGIKEVEELLDEIERLAKKLGKI